MRASLRAFGRTMAIYQPNLSQGCCEDGWANVSYATTLSFLMERYDKKYSEQMIRARTHTPTLTHSIHDESGLRMLSLLQHFKAVFAELCSVMMR